MASQFTENPYLNARREWNSLMSKIVSASRIWQIIALILLLITLGAVGGLIQIGSQSKFVPYVVEVDKLGQPLVISSAAAATPVDPRVMQSTLSAFVSQWRTITPDANLERKNILDVYALIGNQKDPAFAKLNQYFNGSADASPFKKAEKEEVSVEIISAIPQIENTWQVEWSETARDRQGVQISKTTWKAFVTTAVIPPTNKTSETQFRANPFGIYVKDFSASQELH